jgi:HEPN domain-containing protein
MTRRDFQLLTRLRLRDAKTLVRGGNSEGAYYMAGLVVECALKSAIARKTQRHEFPPKPTVVSGMYVHDLNKLLMVAGLESALDTAVASNPALKTNWSLVKDWTVESRYLAIGLDGEELYRAVAGRNGVLRWLRQYW